MVAVDELRSGVHPADPRGTWALGYTGASMTSRHGFADSRDDANGPNNLDPRSDDVIGCGAVVKEKTLPWLLNERMPCNSAGPGPETNSQATSRSQHPGGVHVLMLGGSAHFITDSVNPEVWYKIHSSNHNKGIELPF
jgi:hypothetical protein